MKAAIATAPTSAGIPVGRARGTAAPVPVYPLTDVELGTGRVEVEEEDVIVVAFEEVVEVEEDVEVVEAVLLEEAVVVVLAAVVLAADDAVVELDAALVTLANSVLVLAPVAGNNTELVCAAVVVDVVAVAVLLAYLP